MVKLTVNGKPVVVPDGAMVSAAVTLAGANLFRRSVTGEPRGPLCGMGICFECRVTINGHAHTRSCQTPCTPGMQVRTDDHPQSPTASRPLAPGPRSLTPDLRPPAPSPQPSIVIVGSGPAGLAAARRALESGAPVTMIDDNPGLGGQIWRSLPIPGKWTSKPEVIHGARVIAQPAPNTLTLETFDGEIEIRYRALILATGARERWIPFPGWTLPHVMGAGGLQALAKSGMPIAGKRVVIAGSGPLLLAVAKYLRDHDAKVVSIAEQADQTALARFALTLSMHLGKALQAAQLRAGLLGIPYRTSCWPIAAAPGSITLRRGGKTWSEACDYVACGFGLIPNIELAALLGCRIQDGSVTVDEFQQTSVPNIYAAGEVTGIGGLDRALVEGEIAAYAATGNPDEARRRFSSRESHRRFATALERAFALREELRSLPHDDTLVCRCEDVSMRRLRACAGWREAKLHTRCGMGPCQGRVCGGAVDFLFGWKSESVRPPVFPARIGSLTSL